MKQRYVLQPFHSRNLNLFRRIAVLLAVALLWVGESYAIGKAKSPEEYETSVEALFDRTAWDEGMELLKEGLKLYPESSELNGLAGTYYYQRQDYDNARYFLVRAVKDSPDNVRAKSLLINVEEQTGNYSSAICYVNELLELSPYWPGLWKRKIGLYRKQGDDAEADRMLKRLFEIYPNDSLVRVDYLSRLEENYMRERKNGDRAAAVRNLRELLDNDRSNETHYLDLVNLLLQEGDQEAALGVTSEGVQMFPCSETLIAKKAEILSGMQRYPEALAFLNERIAACPRAGTLYRLRNSITGEYARAQRESDPYRLYGRLYDSGQDPEALDYLLNEALRSGRDEDARRYIAEARRLRGDSPELLYKEYDLLKRTGSPRAVILLERLYESDPSNTDLAEELCNVKYTQAEALARDGSYAEAVERLAFVAENAPDPELRIAAMRKSHSLLLQLKRPEPARRMLERMRPSVEPEEYAVRMAETEVVAGNPAIALEGLYRYMNDYGVAFGESRVSGIYEEMATPYIKNLLESGDWRHACLESRRAVEVCPGSELLLLYAVASHSQAGDKTAADEYIRQGLQRFPGHPAFTEKMAASLYADGRYREAVGLLTPRVDSLPGNRNLVASLSANSDALARERIRTGDLDGAMSCIDSALVYDPGNRDLALVKGLVYEKRERYDSAYLFQSRYLPDTAQARDFGRHLTALQYRSLKNELSMGVLWGGYVNGRSFTPITEVSYSWSNSRNRFFVTPSYTARERDVDADNENLVTEGGQGVRVVAGWERRIGRRWNLSLAAGWANAFFPSVTAAASLSYDFKRDWSLGLNLGYRTLDRDQIEYGWSETTDETTGEIQGSWVAERYVQIEEQLFNVGLTATKSYESLALTLNGEAFVMGGHCYANGSAQLKYLPFGDRISFIRASVGVGNAPELDIIDRALPGCFDQINFSAGIGAGYLMGRHLLIGLDLSCSTLYTQDGIRTGSYDNFTEDISTEYKNTLNANVYVTFRF